MRRRFWFIPIFALLLPAAPGRAQERNTSIAVIGSITTESKLFFNSDSPDDLARASYFPFSSTAGAGLDLRRYFPESRLTFGCSIEYLSRTSMFNVPLSSSPVSPTSSTVTVPVSDGYAIVPVELAAYFTIPLGSDEVFMYIGGGGGAYFGSRIYHIGPEEAVTLDRTAGYGIHVLSGGEYFCSPLISLRLEVKFRDAHFNTVNRFLTPTTTVNGVGVVLPSTPLASRISVDGMDLALQLAYHF